MPQILMLNHAAWVNKQRSDKRYKTEKQHSSAAPSPAGARFHGKPIDQLTTEEYTAYLRS